MKLDLESPFKELWRKAYLRQSEDDGRRRVDLFNTSVDRTTISYARYLWIVNNGSFIPDGYEVDHINSDCSDDRLENLQLLTYEEHLEKTIRESTIGRVGEYIVCPSCKVTFFIESRNKGNSKNNFCSRECNGKFNYNIGNLKLSSNKKILTEEQKQFIINSRKIGKSDYWISDESGISRPKIQRFRKENNID